MTSRQNDELPPIEPLDLSEITSDPIPVKCDFSTHHHHHQQSRNHHKDMRRIVLATEEPAAAAATPAASAALAAASAATATVGEGEVEDLHIELTSTAMLGAIGEGAAAGADGAATLAAAPSDSDATVEHRDGGSVPLLQEGLTPNSASGTHSSVPLFHPAAGTVDEGVDGSAAQVAALSVDGAGDVSLLAAMAGETADGVAPQSVEPGNVASDALSEELGDTTREYTSEAAVLAAAATLAQESGAADVKDESAEPNAPVSEYASEAAVLAAAVMFAQGSTVTADKSVSVVAGQMPADNINKIADQMIDTAANNPGIDAVGSTANDAASMAAAPSDGDVSAGSAVALTVEHRDGGSVPLLQEELTLNSASGTHSSVPLFHPAAPSAPAPAVASEQAPAPATSAPASAAMSAAAAGEGSPASEPSTGSSATTTASSTATSAAASAASSASAPSAAASATATASAASSAGAPSAAASATTTVRASTTSAAASAASSAGAPSVGSSESAPSTESHKQHKRKRKHNAPKSETVYEEVVGRTPDGKVITRKRKRRVSSATIASRKRRRRILTVCLTLAVLAAACFAFVSIGGYSLRHGGLTAGELFGNTAVVNSNEGRTVEYNGSTYAYKENMVSVLFIGYDTQVEADRKVQGDALIMVAIDTDTGKITCISIPRDSMVDVDAVIGDVFTGTQTMQICLAFSYGEGSTKSCEYTARAVSRVLFNMPVSSYFALNMQGVAPLNDAIGGVALTPLATIPEAGTVKGVPTVLQGNQALAYVQSRGDEVDASLERQERQKQYVQAFASQAFGAAKGDVSVLLDLFNIARDYSTTNLGPTEFAYLASVVLAHGVSSVNMVSLSGTMVQGDVYSEFYLDYDNVMQTVLNTYYVKISD